jgi:ribonuclease P protein component
MLARKYKLKKDNDFKKVFQQGKYFEQDFFKLRLLKNNLETSRFGIVIGLKVSKKAVERNKAKRQIEEIIHSIKEIKPGFDIVIRADSEILKRSYQEIEKSLISLFKKAELWEY